jgi:dienelactone hydrolase
MTTPLLGLVAGVGILGVTTLLRGDTTATPPASTSNGWNSKWFSYTAPAKLAVEIATPTADQVDFRTRPRPMRADAPEPLATTCLPKPVTVGPVDVRHLRFRDADGDIVPALLCTPADRSGPFPLVVAVHGFNSNKAQVCGQIAGALAKHGFATLAPDMPLHGERPGIPISIFDKSDPLNYRRAVMDVRQCIDAADALPQLLDTRTGVILAGYSMGSWINAVAGPADDRVKAMVLMVGGATDMSAASMLIPQLAAVDPSLAIAHFAGRPVLMLNAKNDYTVTPDMARRLYAAAPQPKKQLWYESGHLLPQNAYEDAATWVTDTWKAISDRTSR